MSEWLKRSEAVYGKDGIEKLKNSRVIIMGVGGVGCACIEAITRSGIGNIMIVDMDTVDISNLNRQIIATTENVGKNKVDEMKKRMLSINPSCNISAIKSLFLPENSDFVFDYNPDFIVDAIDTVTSKLFLIEKCSAREIPLITCLGTGNRVNPQELTLGDISQTGGYGCPLARVMRKELKRMGIEKAQVVFSKEIPYKSIVMEDSFPGRHSPASTSFVPPVAGYIMAGHVVRQILGI